MCLILLAVEKHPKYPVIMAANRDERYDRKTLPMHWWPQQHILAGKDCEAYGTWLGLNASGRIAAITNVREANKEQGIRSRGQLATDWLTQSSTVADFQQQLDPTLYAGFNLILGNLRAGELYHLSNRQSSISPITEGLHGLSNANFNSPWPKIQTAMPLMEALCKKAFDANDWLRLLSSRDIADDKDLPDTGIGIASERLLSPRFIQGDDYGTRCSTLITLDNDGVITVYEKSFNEKGVAIGHRIFRC